MKAKGIAALVLGSAVACGCAGVPFRATPPVPMETADPRKVLERFQDGVPESFQLVNSVVFEYGGRTYTGIGSLEIDTKSRTFKVACLNPIGVKLFEVSGEDRRITSRFVIDALAKYGDIAAAIGHDIERIYLDLVPSREARSRKRKYHVAFRQDDGPGYLEYEFAGPYGDLVEKRYYEDFTIVWQVSYYEYAERNGKRTPLGIVYVNYRHGYRLIVRQKEFHS
jgi:hypothetical protein